MHDKCMQGTVIQEILPFGLFCFARSKIMGYFRFCGSIFTEESSRKKLSCATQSGTVIYGEQSSLQVNAFV